jgi:hypothetical protein
MTKTSSQPRVPRRNNLRLLAAARQPHIRVSQDIASLRPRGCAALEYVRQCQDIPAYLCIY